MDKASWKAGSAIDIERELTAISDMNVLRQPYITAAYATGSLLAGMGTPTSDIDIILLVVNDEDKDAAIREGALRRHDTVRADFEVFTVAEFSDIVASCADFRAAWDSHEIYRLAQPIRLLSQFTAAARVLKPSPELTALSERITGQRASLARLSVSRAVAYANNVHEDVLGFIHVEDEVGMLRRSHDYLRFGLDAWCTALGAIYPDDRYKWLWRRLNAVHSDERELSDLRSLYVPELAVNPVPEIARRRVDVTQGLLAHALLAAWAADPSACQAMLLPRWSRTGEDTLWRAPDWMPIRTPDAWALGAGFQFQEMSIPAVVAWACAGGRTRDELAALVAQRSRTAFGLDVRPAAAQSVVNRLIGRGALQLGTTFTCLDHGGLS